MTKEAYYFPHDNNAHNDPKLMGVFMQTGLAGIGLYWILIEILHQQEDGRITVDQFKSYIDWHTSKEKGEPKNEHMFNMFSTNGLFVFDDEGFVTSKRVQENKIFRNSLVEKRRNAGKASALARAKPTHVQQNGTHAQQGKGNEKEKEKKVLNIEESNGAVAPITGPVLTEVYMFSPPQNEKATVTTSPKRINLDFFIMDIDTILGAFDFSDEAQKEKVREEIEKFRDYWTEWNGTKTKMRWQMEKTFEVRKRLKTWFRNVRGFTSPGFAKPDRVGDTINLF